MLASGATAIAGFAALIASDIRMLRDFGIVTVVDLTVSLLGVMLVLPAALVWAEQHGAFTPARPRPATPAARAQAAAALGRLAGARRGGPAPDDRFSDLGAEEAGRRRRQAIGDKLAERDRVAPEPDDRRPEVPRPGNKYAWVVGIVMLMGDQRAAAPTDSSCRTRGSGRERPDSQGTRYRSSPLHSPRPTWKMTRTPTCARARPCPAQAGSVPACELASEIVLNICELRRDPVVLTFMVTTGADCEPQVDRVERMLSDFPGVRFARGHER